MKLYYTMALSILAGAALGATAVQTIHAQAKAPAYSVLEADVSNPEAYAKEYLPKVQAMFKASGAHYLATAGATPTGPKIVGIEGDPPKRVAIQRWDNLEKLTAFFNSAEFKEVRAIGQKYAKFRAFAVEALPQ
jgi:uncharacterized protein (DUF1330 family)